MCILNLIVISIGKKILRCTNISIVIHNVIRRFFNVFTSKQGYINHRPT